MNEKERALLEHRISTVVARLEARCDASENFAIGKRFASDIMGTLRECYAALSALRPAEPVVLRHLIWEFERRAANTDTSPYWRAASALREIEGWQATSFPLFASPPAESAEARWMPIESAPKDGTTVLLWCLDDEPEAVAGQWFESRDWEGWQYADACLRDITPEMASQPTHWQPITPPLAARSAR